MGEVLGILFLAIVAPIWIIAHYATRWRTSRALSREDEELLSELRGGVDRMEARIRSLERILDAEAAGWRDRA